MSEAHALTAPESKPPQTVPFGAGTALAAAALTYAIYVLGTVGVELVAGRKLTLLAEIGSYQFLVLGTIISAVLLVLARFNLGPQVLGYRFPGWEPLGKSLLIAFPIVIAGVLLLYVIFNAFFPSFHLQGNGKELFKGLPKHISGWKEGLIIVWSSIEAPLTEETLFRGMIFQGLRHFFARWLPYQVGVFGAALVSGAVFGAAHLGGGPGEIHTLPILIFVGIVLAYVFQLTRSIYASALVHAVINFLGVVFTFGIVSLPVTAHVV